MWDKYLADPLAPCRHPCRNQTRRKYLARPTRNSLLSVYLKNSARSLSPQENNSWLLDTDFRSLFSNIMFFCHRFVILGFSFHLGFFCPSLFSPLPNLCRRDDTNRSLHYFDVMNSVARGQKIPPKILDATHWHNKTRSAKWVSLPVLAAVRMNQSTT